jgi:hypothetical protein
MSFSAQILIEGKPKQVGYGLPCANCRAYYGADLTSCPICGCVERVPANGEVLAHLGGQSHRILISPKSNDVIATNRTERLQ